MLFQFRTGCNPADVNRFRSHTRKKNELNMNFNIAHLTAGKSYCISPIKILCSTFRIRYCVLNIIRCKANI